MNKDKKLNIICECKQLRLNYTTMILHCIKCGKAQNRI
jgi:hypothetical protein